MFIWIYVKKESNGQVLLLPGQSTMTRQLKEETTDGIPGDLSPWLFNRAHDVSRQVGFVPEQ